VINAAEAAEGEKWQNAAQLSVPAER